MQQEIDHIMRTVSSRTTAEIARQELQALVAQHVTAMAREQEQRVTELQRRVTDLEQERDAGWGELNAVRQRAAELEKERNAALEERDVARNEGVAARRERFALRQRVATLEEEVAGLRNSCSLTRQPEDDLLRHVLSATVDFRNFVVKRVVAVGGNGTVLECDVTVPAWCLLNEPQAAADAADAANAADAAPADAAADAHQSGRPGRTAHVTVPVAVKVLAGVEDPRHTALKHRFLREFHTLSAMPPHPNVASLLAYLTKALPKPMYDRLPEGFRLLVGRPANPVLALIMPLHPRTLEAAAAAGAEPAQLVRWCLEVSAAVAHMWTYGWVHLDLKLNNVLVASDGRAVLTDMGTAMPVAEDGSLSVLAHMGLEGNAAHRAPEVLASWENAQRHPACMVRIDAGRQEVWALGVLLHELVAGTHPYGGAYPLDGHTGEVVMSNETLVARGLPADMAAVLRRMVSSDPAARPANPAAGHAELLDSITVPAAQRPATVTALMDVHVGGDAAAARNLHGAEPIVPEPEFAPPLAPSRTLSPQPDGEAFGAPVEAPPSPAPVASSPAVAAVPLCEVEHTYHASKRYVPRDPATGQKEPNQWGRQLLAWSLLPGNLNDAARLCLALLHWWGEGGMQQNWAGARALAERSLPWCQDAAEGEERVAQWLMGCCCFAGLGVARDYAQATVWFRRAAEQGHVQAQYWLGSCYLNGDGVAMDREQAAVWYRRAAEAGHAEAQYWLGDSYYLGRGVAQDYEQALEWRRRAAVQGHAQAQFWLGYSFEYGRGVAQDNTEAALWYRRAADQGHAQARSALRSLGQLE